MGLIFLNTPTFVGIRVRRNIARVPYERHYSFRVPGKPDQLLSARQQKLLEKEAQVYDAELHAQQLRERRRRSLEAKPTKRSNTSIAGIVLGYAYDRYRDKIIKTPAFLVSCRNVDGMPVKKPFLISVLGYRGAWDNAVQHFIKVKKMPRDAAEKVLKRRPPPRPAGLATRPRD